MKNIIQNIRRLFFDNSCTCCGEKASDNLIYLCYNCLDKIVRQKSLNKVGDTYYIWPYKGEFRKLLLEYKNNSRLALGKIISSLIEEEIFKVVYEEDIDYIVPIPINFRREQIRGFNQVEEILKNLNYSFLKTNRVKNTKKMFKLLDKEKRENNIKNSFKVDKEFKTKNILIFDDIITTGATIEEFKRELIKNGEVNKIVVFSLSASKTYMNSNKRMC